MSGPAANLPPAVDWYEGMLLAPQHFQLAAHRSEALQQLHASLAAPFHWGLLDLERTFANGVLKISRLEAILPDGLVVSLPPKDGHGQRELSLDLNPLAAKLSGTQTIFLAAAARQPGQSFDARYDSRKWSVSDEKTGRDDLAVKVLHPRLSLAVADYLPASSVGFPIARALIRSGAITEVEFEPPWLRVRCDSPLHELCTRIAEQLRNTAVSLQSSTARQSSSQRGAQLLETRMLIHSLVSGLPALEVLLRSDAAHPFALYLSLASILGNLAPGSVPKRLDAYDHDDLLPLFRALETRIAATIGDAIHPPYALKPFDEVEDGFRITIEPEWIGRPWMIGVRSRDRVDPNDTNDWIVESTIGAASKIDELRTHRVIGVKRERLRDSKLLPAAGAVFYALRPLESDSVGARQDLVISNGDRTRVPQEITLYVDIEG